VPPDGPKQQSDNNYLGVQLRLNQISDADADIIRQIVKLAQQLSAPLETFTAAIGAIREQELGIPGRCRHRQETVERRR
jgi:hypothetical protein